MNAGEKELTAVEQHLGDRLAALVDGELGHDARERVLSHLATCWSCRAEADAQRRLKSVFADTAPPPPSDGLMARLQGLPAGGGGDTGGLGRPGFPGGPGASALPGPDDSPRAGIGDGRASPMFAHLPGGGGPSVLEPSHGFRLHREHEFERSSRGRRFAFAAAGAFSLAALALGGTVGGATAGGPALATGDRGGPTAGQARPAATSAPGDRETRRRAAAARAGSGEAAKPLSPSTLSLQKAPIGLAAAHGRPLLADYAFFAPSFIRPPLPPRVLPGMTTPPDPVPPLRTPDTGAAPAPSPGAPMAGSRP